MSDGLQPADYAWLALCTAALIFEFTSSDLLTHSTERMVKRHPILTRVGILALAGHLAFVLPPYLDLLSNKNIFHQGVALGYKRARRHDRHA